MTDEREQPPYHAHKVYRLITGCFGLFLSGVGIFALFVDGSSMLLRWTAGLALLIVGGNLAVSAIKARESWLSKLGPLP